MKGNKTETNNRYVENLEKHLDRTRDSSKYASDRFDILIVTISTTALVVTLGSVNNLIGKNEVDTSLLKISWLLFVVTIITNLTSQLTSYYSHRTEEKITRNLIRIERNKDPLGKQDYLERLSSRLNNATQIFNMTSFITLFLAIIVIVIFYSKNI